MRKDFLILVFIEMLEHNGLMHRDVEGEGGGGGDHLKVELSHVLAEESLGLTDEKKAVIRKNVDSLGSKNKFHDPTFFEKVLNSPELSSEQSYWSNISSTIYSYGLEKKFVIGRWYNPSSIELSDEQKQDIVIWMLNIQGVTVEKGQLIKYLRENRKSESLKDIARTIYCLGFGSNLIRLGQLANDPFQAIRYIDTHVDGCCFYDTSEVHHSNNWLRQA